MKNLNVALKELFDFASSKRETSFSTSFSSYSICQTPDEVLIDSALEEQLPEKTAKFLSSYEVDAINLLERSIELFEATPEQAKLVELFCVEIIAEQERCDLREEEE